MARHKAGLTFGNEVWRFDGFGAETQVRNGDTTGFFFGVILEVTLGEVFRFDHR